ncbi:hypothetical protein EBU24_04025 [bacterium]|nr:hypothetical protein [bacterium]
MENKKRFGWGFINPSNDSENRVYYFDISNERAVLEIEVYNTESGVLKSYDVPFDDAWKNKFININNIDDYIKEKTNNYVDTDNN